MEVLFFNLSLNLRSLGLSSLGSYPGTRASLQPTSHWLRKRFRSAALADLRSTAVLLSSLLFLTSLFDHYVLAGFTVMNAATKLPSVTPWTQSVIDTTLR